MASKSRQPLTGPRMNAVVICPLKKTNTAGTLGDAITDAPLLVPAIGGLKGYTLANGPSYTGYVEDVEFDQEYETEDGTLLGQEYANDILGVHRTTATLSEILRYRSANNSAARQGNFLAAAYNSSIKNATDGTAGTAPTNSDGDDAGAKEVKVLVRRGGEVFTFYGQMRSYREAYRKGKAMGVMTITCLDAADGGDNSHVRVNNPAIGTYTQDSASLGT